jgi:hypothetical protein
MIAIIVAGTSRMIRMRMIPSDYLQTALARSFFGVENVFASDREAIPRRIIAAIYERMKRVYLAVHASVRRFRITPEKRSTTFVRIGFRTVAANPVRQLGSYL